MINHIWTVLCSRTITDKETNNLSLINTIEQLTIKDEPKPNGVLPISMELCSFWTRTDPDQSVEGAARILFVEPLGNSKLMVEYPIDLQNKERSRNIIRISSIPVSIPGRHLFRIELKTKDKDWTEVSSIPLRIVFTKEIIKPALEINNITNKSQ